MFKTSQGADYKGKLNLHLHCELLEKLSSVQTIPNLMVDYFL